MKIYTKELEKYAKNPDNFRFLNAAAKGFYALQFPGSLDTRFNGDGKPRGFTDKAIATMPLYLTLAIFAGARRIFSNAGDDFPMDLDLHSTVYKLIQLAKEAYPDALKNLGYLYNYEESDISVIDSLPSNISDNTQLKRSLIPHRDEISKKLKDSERENLQIFFTALEQKIEDGLRQLSG